MTHHPRVTISATDADLQYIARAVKAIDENDGKIFRWLTNTCPECERGGRIIEKDDLHLTYKGKVILGCEWYRVIAPQVLGMPEGQWQDWTEPTPDHTYGLTREMVEDAMRDENPEE